LEHVQNYGGGCPRTGARRRAGPSTVTVFFGPSTCELASDRPRETQFCGSLLSKKTRWTPRVLHSPRVMVAPHVAACDVERAAILDRPGRRSVGFVRGALVVRLPGDGRMAE